LVSSNVFTTIVLVVGVILLIEGATLVTPIALFLAPILGTSQTLEVTPSGRVFTNQYMNVGDRFISEIVMQGGSLSLRIQDPQNMTVRNETISGQRYVLSLKADSTGFYTIFMTSRENMFLVTRTMIMRSVLGFEATTIIGGVLVVPTFWVLVTSNLPGKKRREFLKPDEIRKIVPDRQAVLVVAPPCDEYDQMVDGFLEGSLNSGKSALYVSFRTAAVEDCVRKHPGKVFAITSDSKAKDRLSSAGGLAAITGVADLTNLDISVSQLLGKIDFANGAVAYFEVLSDILLAHNLPVARKWLTETLAKLRDRGVTTVASVNPKMVPAEKVSGAADVFDGYMEMIENPSAHFQRMYLHWVRRPKK
jgi:hypothetical protein